MSAVQASATTPGAARADVFISYAREDRDTAAALAQALGEAGLKVWWDRHIVGGEDFADAIGRQLAGCRMALVLWSEDGVRSNFVRDEAARLRDAGKLLPLRIAIVPPPVGFGTLHTLDLLDWDGDSQADAFVSVLATVQGRLAGKEPVLPADGGRSRLRVRRWTRRALLAAGGATLAAGGLVGWRRLDRAADRERAQALFSRGVASLEDSTVRLRSAREDFLSAVRLQPDFARAHFYLAQVYVRMSEQAGEPEDREAQREAARASYRRALAEVGALDALDSVQQGQARRQLAALAQDGSTAVARADEDGPQAKLERPRAPTRPATSAAPRPAAAGATRPAGTPPGPGRLPAPVQPAADTAADPGLPPDAAVRQALAPRVDAAFSPEQTARVSAVTALVLDPAALSDAIPVALERALHAQAAAPGDAVTEAGVVNTLVLLRSASPATLRANRAAVESLLAAARGNGPVTAEHAARVAELLRRAADAPPVVYLQIAGDAQRPLALSLARQLREKGYRVPDLEIVGPRAPQRSAVRVQGNSSQALARACALLLGRLAGAPPEIETLRNTRPRTDTYELWLAQGLCAQGGRAMEACEA